MTWDVFISHASEDADEVARPLAEALTKAGLSVWYDELALTLGDSLSDSVDRGLAGSKFGVVILSPNFFAKAWTRRELNGLSAKEARSGKVILPVWHDVTPEEVERFSPVLADKVSVSTSAGLDVVVQRILRAVETGSEPPSYDNKTDERRPRSWQNVLNWAKERRRRLILGVFGLLAAAVLAIYAPESLVPRWWPFVDAAAAPAPAPTPEATIVSAPASAPAPTPIPASPVPSPTLTPIPASAPTSPTLAPTPALPSPTPGATPGPPAPTLAAGVTANPTASINLVSRFEAPGRLTNGIAWDGANLWASNNSGDIFKLDQSGKTIDVFSSPEVTPEGLVWDGSRFWVFTTNYSFIYGFRLDQGDTRTVSSFLSPNKIIGGTNDDLAWDGEHLWYSDRFKVYKLDTSGNVVDSFALPDEVAGLTWDGQNLWIAHNHFPANAELKMADRDGNILGSYTSPVFQIESLSWDGQRLLAAGRDSLGGGMYIYQLETPTREPYPLAGFYTGTAISFNSPPAQSLPGQMELGLNQNVADLEGCILFRFPMEGDGPARGKVAGTEVELSYSFYTSLTGRKVTTTLKGTVNPADGSISGSWETSNGERGSWEVSRAQGALSC